MQNSDYKREAENLLKKFDEICANPSQYTRDFYFLDIDDWSREFRHLVYSYDPLLPLNKELDKENALVLHYPSMGDFFKTKSAKIRKMVSFFIDYLDKVDR